MHQSPSAPQSQTMSQQHSSSFMSVDSHQQPQHSFLQHSHTINSSPQQQQHYFQPHPSLCASSQLPQPSYSVQEDRDPASTFASTAFQDNLSDSAHSMSPALPCASASSSACNPAYPGQPFTMSPLTSSQMLTRQFYAPRSPSPTENITNVPKSTRPQDWKYLMRREMQEIVPGLFLGPFAAASPKNVSSTLSLPYMLNTFNAL